MEPGEELDIDIDIEIAMKVMGWTAINGAWCTDVTKHSVNFHCGTNDFRPSTDISAAWQVVDEIVGVTQSTFYLWWNDSACEWLACFDPKRQLIEGCRYKASAETPAHAICLAALKATQSKEK